MIETDKQAMTLGMIRWMKCPQCTTRMQPARTDDNRPFVINGWINADCPKCGTVEPRPLLPREDTRLSHQCPDCDVDVDFVQYVKGKGRGVCCPECGKKEIIPLEGTKEQTTLC